MKINFRLFGIFKFFINTAEGGLKMMTQLCTAGGVIAGLIASINSNAYAIYVCFGLIAVALVVALTERFTEPKH